MSVETHEETSGRRVVGYLYATAVVLAAAFGYLVGVVIQPNISEHAGSLGPFVFELTPLNLAVYGAIMVGAALGVFFLLAGYATRYEE